MTVSHIGATVITEVCVHHTGCFSWKSSPLWLQGVSRLPRSSSATHHRHLTKGLMELSSGRFPNIVYMVQYKNLLHHAAAVLLHFQYKHL